jgi:hypothetical protein
LIQPGLIRDLVDETALAHDAQEIGFEGGHCFFLKAPGPNRPA